MGVFTFTDEYTSPVPAARLFKALILDNHNVIPKLMPQKVKSIDLLNGNGGPGTIKQFNFVEGSPVPYLKNRVDELDEKTFTYKYTLIEGGGPLLDKLDHIVYEVKLEPTPEGGSKNKMTSTYHTKGDIELKEEDVKDNKEKVFGMYKIVEAFLIENPNAYT